MRHQDADIERFASRGAIRSGHFRYGYPLNMCTDLIIDSTKLEREDLEYFAERLASCARSDVEAIVGWGKIAGQLARWCSFSLTAGKSAVVSSLLIVERAAGWTIESQELTQLAGKKVMVVGGVLVSHLELFAQLDLCRMHDLEVVQFAYLWDRSGIDPSTFMEAALTPIIDFPVELLHEEACRDCRVGTKYTRLALLPEH